ncbi:hypothetical protein QP992_00295 [Corynebacterium ulcerans]|uniref:hypothetical protein n=1 Tax=Corynebacterium ulcerans TaxID=65058 RepID=UPI000214171C|nr:hypothetical protein [Corynebacterium ulcerans]AEG84518.1 hypothetical protein CULC22_01809 [Corynebacterium ulcerans BR-AD22]MDK8887582.1 hypothetical protein [Corynebacterium ulcerans]
MPETTEKYGLLYPTDDDTIRSLPSTLSRMAKTISQALNRIERLAKEAQENSDPETPMSKAAIMAGKIQQAITDIGITQRQIKAQAEKIKALETRIEALEKGASTPSPTPPEIQSNQVEITWSASNSKAEITGGDVSLVRSTTGGQVRFTQNMTATVSVMEIPSYSERKPGEVLLSAGTRKFMPYGVEDVKIVFTKA